MRVSAAAAALLMGLGVSFATAQEFQNEASPLFENCGDASYEKAKTEGITVGISPSPPFTSLNPETQKAEGLEVEIDEAAIKWAGIDMLSCANNHAFDYGSTGILETIENAEAAGLIVAGIGANLQAARQAAFLGCPGGTVAMVSMAATFIPYGRASQPRSDMRGRPGLNPLALTKRGLTTITPAMARRLDRFHDLVPSLWGFAVLPFVFRAESNRSRPPPMSAISARIAGLASAGTSRAESR